MCLPQPCMPWKLSWKHGPKEQPFKKHKKIIYIPSFMQKYIICEWQQLFANRWPCQGIIQKRKIVPEKKSYHLIHRPNMHSHLIWTFHYVLHHPKINQCLLILMCSYTDPFGQLTHRHLVSVLRPLLLTLRAYFYPVEPSGSFPRRRRMLSLDSSPW